MRFGLLFSLMFRLPFCALPASAAAEPNLSAESFSILNKPLRNLNVRGMDEALRVKIVDELKSAKTNPRFEETHGLRPDLALIELGDRATLEQFIKNKYHPYGVNSMPALRFLGDLTQPQVIVALSADLMADETVVTHPHGYDGVYPAKSVAAAEVTKRILINAPEFTQATKDWALTIRDYPREAKRGAFQAFWRENATDLTIGDYAKVHPPELIVRKLPMQNNSQATNSSPGDNLPAFARPPTKRAGAILGTNTASATQTASAAPVAPVVPASSTASTALWSWLLLAGGILAGWLWWRSR